MRKKLQGFTLVELIVVITILAILGTIAFISLQGYAGDARNTKRISDLTSIQSAITTSVTQGISIMSYAKNDNFNDSRVLGISIGGSSPSVGVEYEAGHVNYTALGLKAADFSDPGSNAAYVLGVTNRSGGKYELATSIEAGATKSAKVAGDYMPRSTTIISGNSYTGTINFVITNTANISIFKVGDTISGGKVISAISSNGLTLTVDSPFASTQTGVALLVAESAGLIDRFDSPALSGNNIVINNGTVNFPDIPAL